MQRKCSDVKLVTIIGHTKCVTRRNWSGVLEQFVRLDRPFLAIFEKFRFPKI